MHNDTCECRDCRRKRIEDVELKGDNPVFDFLRILTKVAPRRSKAQEDGGNTQEE